MNSTRQCIDDFIPADALQASMDRLATYKVSGKDRGEFLQGQLSNDVTSLASGSAQLTSYSNAKGRVLAIMRLAAIGDDWFLLLDKSIAESVIQRLRMFVLRSDVVFEREEVFTAVVVAGVGAKAQLEALAGNASLATLDVPGTLPRIEIFGHDLPALATPASESGLRSWDTLSGLLQVDSGQTEQHVAQMLNLDRLGAIHFRKGCYAGQEIIARMHYLGKLKKRALPLFATKGVPGDAVLSGDGKKIGEILQSSDVSRGRLHLAMLNLDAADDALRLEDGSAVTVLDTGLGHLGESTDPRD